MRATRGRDPLGASREDDGKGECLRRRRVSLRDQGQAVISSIGTVLLVTITVAMMVIVGVFVMGIAQFEEPAPELEVVVSADTNSMHAHIRSVSDARPISEFRLIAMARNGTLVTYDSDGDALGDMAMSHDLDLVTVGSATGPQKSPLVFVDTDQDGRVNSGDYMTFRHPFFPPLSPFIDATHGYKVVKQAPSGIPRDSRMLVVVSTDTLVGGEVRPGDLVRVTIAKGGTVYHQVEGFAIAGGVFTAVIEIPMTWVPATYSETSITVRPGEDDEWSMGYPFKVEPENPPSKAEQAYFGFLNNPIVEGTVIMMVHKPTNTVVLEFTV